MSLSILTHAFGFDSPRSKWNAPIFFSIFRKVFQSTKRPRHKNEGNDLRFRKTSDSWTWFRSFSVQASPNGATDLVRKFPWGSKLQTLMIAYLPTLLYYCYKVIKLSFRYYYMGSALEYGWVDGRFSFSIKYGTFSTPFLFSAFQFTLGWGMEIAMLRSDRSRKPSVFFDWRYGRTAIFYSQSKLGVEIASGTLAVTSSYLDQLVTVKG